MAKLEYQKYEFCKAFKCKSFVDGKCQCVTDNMCRFTAKEFHKYLEAQKYKIVKEGLEYGM